MSSLDRAERDQSDRPSRYERDEHSPRRRGCLTGAAAGIGGLVILALALAGLGSMLTFAFPSLNPFKETTVDRTGQSVLKSLTDIKEFHAASAHYETVVDIEKDTRYLPAWVSGERILYVGKGDVNGVVDFSDLDESRVQLDADNKKVSIRLPAPRMSKPNLDIANSYVFSHDKGMTDQFGGSELEREAQIRAIEQMTKAAEDGVLAARSKENTISMLEGLLGALDYQDVTITFDDEPMPETSTSTDSPSDTTGPTTTN